ncbi:MAG: hypothetical protein ACREOF_04975, partial [Gemmatimonadales bacterium]
REAPRLGLARALASGRISYRRVGMRAYLQISGTLFGLIALGHLLRLVRHWPDDLAGYVVPLWASWLGLVLAGGLSIWALWLVRAARRVV